MKNMKWIAVDWGTSKLRIWAMDEFGQVLAEVRADDGMAGLNQNDYEKVLLSHISGWLTDEVTPVIACGMVGSRQGWFEAPYAKVPTKAAAKYVNVDIADGRFSLSIVSGVMQSHKADVMRGEETQISGFLVGQPNFEGVICLPGTHSKWVQIEAGEIKQFQTAMTGEIFGLLSQKSVLRHSQGSWSDEAFKQAFEDIYNAPENALSSLFSIRAQDLLNGDGHGVARLSGSLIASEFAGMKHYWQGQTPVLIGAGELVRLYQLGFELLDLEVKALRAAPLTMAGLHRVYEEVNL